MLSKRLLLLLAGLVCCLVSATEIHASSNTVLTLTTDHEGDSLCSGTQQTVCANLRQNCGSDNYAPLPNRMVLFFLNPGNCGNNVSQIATDSALTSANGNACVTLTLPAGTGHYSLRVKFRGESKPGASDPPNGVCTPGSRVELSSSNDCDEFEIDHEVGTSPVVSLPPDTTVRLCSPGPICLSYSVEDSDCDIEDDGDDDDSGHSWSFRPSETNVAKPIDQVDLINRLGGTVIQIGGGAPGAVLRTASDFVASINTLSGVNVTLLGYNFASRISDFGSFPIGTWETQSASQLLGAPTKIAYTLVGPGGPDGTAGDGAISFSPGNSVSVAFSGDEESCDDDDDDLVMFGRSHNGGVAQIIFKRLGIPVYVVTKSMVPSGFRAGMGGMTINLPTGVVYNEVTVKCVSGDLNLDGIAARSSSPSPGEEDTCFYADTSGVYTIIVSALDNCGHIGADTTLVTVMVNHPPVANAGADFSKFLCALSQICFPVSLTDPDNNIKTTSLISGPGALSSGQICFTPGAAGTFTFIVDVTDSCNLSDRDTIVVTVTTNQSPVAVNPTSQTVFQCTAAQLCYTLTAADPNGGSLNWTKLAGVGTITPNGQFCFMPTTSGTYSATVVVSDSCGAKDTTSIQYTVTINSSPVAVNPATPVSFTQCAVGQVCYQFSASDPNGGSLIWTMLSGSGSVTTSGDWCFTPSGSGSYSVSVQVADSCGKADTTTLTYNVTVNTPPVISLGSDSSVLLCASGQICKTYTVSDPNGSAYLTEALVSGYGSIDTANNRVCFTPVSSGAYQFVVSVTDSCGAVDYDTAVIMVTLSAPTVIDCPSGPISVGLCASGQVCQGLAITPSSAIVSVSPIGTYAGGQLCFNATTSGTYNIRVIASTSCSADTCDLVFNVDINTPPTVTCPLPFNEYICAAGPVCVPVGIAGTGPTVTASPIGTWSAGNLCFNADTSGQYVIKVKATTSCGVDSCFVTVNVTKNGAPVAVNPPASVDTFQCLSAQICRQFSATDPNGNPLTWTRLSGAGSVSSTGLWCFTPITGGAYSVVAQVADSCGAADTITMTYNVALNAAPTISLGVDTSIFQCAVTQFCRTYATSDPNNNIASISLVSGPGTLSPASNELCFTPTGAGSYIFIMSVTDSCNVTAYDTLTVQVTLNNPPMANAGADQAIFQCSLSQICWPAGATDPDNNLSSVQLVSGAPGSTYSGGQICFTPTQTWNYEFVLKATDACGATDFDTVVIYYVLNTTPVANAGSDQTLFQCLPTQICWPATCTDADGNLTSCSLISGPGSYSGTQICFTPTVTGSYQFVMKAIDACGAIGYDTAVINVTVNDAPVCHVPTDTTVFQCVATQICLPTYATDANGNLKSCTIVSGPGALVNGNWCYTPSASQLATVVISCEDSCGAICQSQFSVEIKVNSTPTITFASYNPFFLCAPQQVCLDYSASDPDAPRPVTISLIGGGTLDLANSRVCFNADTAGTYKFILNIQDECGAFDADTIAVSVALNRSPVASAGSDQTLFLCAPAQICWPASCTDPDNNQTQCTFTGPGIFNGSSICFTPTVSGTYTFILHSEDGCYETSTDTAVISLTINEPPSLALGNDTTISLCQSQQLCFDYTVSDPNGLSKIVETMVSGFGSIDTGLNRICFVASSSGSYQFIVRATDSCGSSDDDTLNVTVNIGQKADIVCPSGPINISYCVADSVCYGLAITPANATVTVSQGVYQNGNLCFYADTSGIYNIQVVAITSCGADTCNLTFNVTIGSGAQISCPGSQSKYLCQADSIHVPVTIMGANPTVTVTPSGQYANGMVSFFADTSGVYNINVIATTTCGADTCIIQVTVIVNQPPVATNPPSTVDTFLCAGAQICRQFSATDPNGNALTWTRLSGAGTVTPGGLWCFTANANGDYIVIAAVADSCGAADTVTMIYNVTLNAPPVVQLGNDTTIFQCSGSPVCMSYSVSDPNSNVNLEQLISGLGTIDTVLNKVCFTPAGAGTFTIIVGVTDACGVTDLDTVAVTIDVNDPPTVNAGVDKTIFQCTPASYCFGFTATDPDNNIDSVRLISGPGTLNAGQVCFTPSTSGQLTFIIKAFDHCGLTDEDTVRIIVGVNAPPVCNMPNDTTKFFQCVPTQVSLPVSATDVNGNFDHCELLTGPGSLVGGNWVYTPSVSQVVKVKIQCLDSCGAICVDSVFVKFSINRPPVASAGRDTTLFLCASGSVCVPVSCSDPDGNLQNCEMASFVGTYNPGTGMVCMTADFGTGSSKIYPIIMKATDSCGVVDYDTSSVTINFNHPPVVQGPPDMTVYLDQIGQVCFDVNITDPENNLVIIDSVSPVGQYNQSTGQVCFNADTTGRYCLTILVKDACGVVKADTVCIDVQIDECIHVQIEKVHNAIQGQHKLVNIFLNGTGKPVGGFDFLISYDASSLTATSATPGSVFQNCGWEYFTYRFGPFGNCGNGCPSGLIRVTGIGETNNGAYHPTCFLDGQSGILATLDFLVSNDRTLECQYAPVQFFWINCGDNTFSSVTGDTLYVSRWVYDFEYRNITNNSFGFPGYLGAPDACLIGGGPGKPNPIRCIDFTNGGVDIICADSIDARGDINLNGLAYEVADAVMFTNYFIQGLSAFAGHIDGSVAASDVNGDGLTLTVGDLVYLIRVVVGDVAPMPKLNPDAVNEVTFAIINDALQITQTSSGVGAIYMQVDGDILPTLADGATGMDMVYRFDGSTTRILISTRGKNSLGIGEVVKLNGVRNIKLIEAGSLEGYVMKTTLSTLPTEFTLSQNYPNPFNPVTTIDFTLPHAADWQLQVFNILGQVVETWTDHNDAGYYKITWDANSRASGVYFYRLSAGSYSSTKKMVLLK